jgi:hypothetical protein
MVSRTPSVASVLVVSALVCGCTGRGGGSGPEQPEVCRIYVECAASATPTDAGMLLELYGSQGTCWKGTNDEAALCEADCIERLDDLREQFPDDDSCQQGLGTSSGEGENGDDSGESDSGPDLPNSNAVDILFIIDNSGTMAEEQAALATSIPALLDALEAPDVDASYRIGVTTTDDGNPWCGSTGPENGNLQMSSCRSRQGDFIFAGDPPTDATSIACTDLCNIDDLDIEPTTTDIDPAPRVRPWVERIDGVTNLSVVDGYSMAEAFQCFAPQGIAGCGFESHLESMRKAVLRTQSPDDDEYGFLRDSAMLVIVIVTDEVDCSFNPEFESIFLPADQGGNPEVFWEDPSQSSPTSAVCWNAGVACTGGPGTYDECHAANKGVNGNDGVAEDDAVLYPLSRYVEILQNVEDLKQETMPGQEVLVALIAGVPPGYETGDADIVYQDATDPGQQLSFGIGPGCTNQAFDPPSSALPPVREREVAEAFALDDRRHVYSVCADDYSPALEAIADAIVGRLGE